MGENGRCRVEKPVTDLDPVIYQNIFYIVIVVAMEIIQRRNYQPIWDSWRDSICFSLALTCLVRLPLAPLWVFLVLAYEMGETCSYIFIKRSMDAFFFTLLDPVFPFRDGHYSLIFFGLVPVVAVFAAVIVPPLCWKSVSTKWDGLRNDHVVFLFLGYCLFVQIDVLTRTSRSTHPKMEVCCGTVPEMLLMRNYFTTPVTASFRPGIKPKNVIEIVLESFETQLLGDYNLKGFKKSMPFLSSMAKSGTHCPNSIMGPEIGWSIAGFFAAHCGLPMVSRAELRNRSPILKVVNKLKCAGDVLRYVGYDRLALYTGDGGYGGLKALLVRHGFEKFKDYENNIHIDKHLVKRVAVELPQLMRNYKDHGRPFALMLGFEDTHPMFRVECAPRQDITGNERILNSCDCLDQDLQDLMQILKQNDVTPENTVIVIHGDHPMVLPFDKVLIGTQMQRNMSIIFPYRTQNLINKTVTIYDIMPSVLDELGIDYQPKFPFGRPVTDPEPGHHPKPSTIDYLWDYFNLR